MPYYKDQQNKVHFLDSAEFVHLLPSGSVEVTKEEADAISSGAVSASDSIKQQIVALEASITTRRLREAVIGTGASWLADVDAQIAVLRSQL